MLLQYSKWKKLHESVQPDATYVTLTYDRPNFSEIENSEFYYKVLLDLFSKFNLLTVSGYEYTNGVLNFDLLADSSDDSDILSILGINTKFHMSFSSPGISQKQFTDFITNAAKLFPNVKRVINESTNSQFKYVIVFGPGEVDSTELLDFIFSDDLIFKTTLKADDTDRLTDDSISSVLGNENAGRVLQSKTMVSFRAKVISELRNLFKVESRTVDLSTYEKQNVSILSDLATRANNFDSFNEPEKLKFVIDILKFQKNCAQLCKDGLAENRIASKNLIRSYSILDSIGISEEEIDRLISLMKKEN